jgi:hypothetical protein
MNIRRDHARAVFFTISKVVAVFLSISVTAALAITCAWWLIRVD